MADETAIDHHYLWLDLETTGLDPAKGRILEFALLLVDDGPSGDMREIDSFSGVVHFDLEDADVPVDSYVRNMHTANGLWEECKAAEATIELVDEALEELCLNLGVPQYKGVLAGASVTFDRDWCRKHLPKFARFLSHRVFDVSTLKAAERSWADPKFADIKADRHRALDDIRASLAEAREIRSRRWQLEMGATT